MNREALGYSDDEQVQRDLIAVSGGWLQPLDTTVVNANVRKRGPEVLTAAVAASAAKLTLADLGLDPQMALFAAALFKELGCTGVASSELEDWAVHADALEGVKNLKVLETLGIVETVREARDQVTHAFNPLAARLLG